MLMMEGDIVAYGVSQDQSLIWNYERINIPKRLEETKRLMSKDLKTFITFIRVVKQWFDKGMLKIAPDELLRINTDKFLEDGVIEYLDYDLSIQLDANNKSKKLKSKNYSSLSVKSSK